ncbi:MAG: N-acetylneuraminate synthase family protein [Vampirovibrio sp.]|nr:N-acetylneuraminate synthase family protein [Vampirovibrio sp.]
MEFLTNLTNNTRCFIIAEAGVNHNGDVGLAYKLIDAAKQAGADAVKFQLFIPHALTVTNAPKAHYQQNETAPEENQQTLLNRLALNNAQMQQLSTYTQSIGLTFLCSPFDEASAEALVRQLELPALKLGSGELTNLPFLRRLAKYQIPMILSTGMATLEEVKEAVTAVEARLVLGQNETGIALMHCTSAYPAPEEALNLNAITTLKKEFPRCLVGYSDHSTSVDLVPAIAVGLGAKLYEKHLTLDKTMVGPDHQASLEPDEFVQLVNTIRQTEAMMGTGVKAPHPVEFDCMAVARKSLVLLRDLPAGHQLEPWDIGFKRPATGLAPRFLASVIGRKLAHPLTAEAFICWDDLVADS